MTPDYVVTWAGTWFMVAMLFMVVVAGAWLLVCGIRAMWRELW